MKAIHYLAAGALALMGIVHVARLSSEARADNAITTLLGIAYIAIAFFLSQENRAARWWGVVLPLVGLVISVQGWLAAPAYFCGYCLISYAVVIGCCLYLISVDMRQKQTAKLQHR